MEQGGVFLIYVYIGCLTFGTLYAFASFLLGGHGADHGSLDHGGLDHSGLDHGTVDSGGDSADLPSPFNPLVLASAIATFGAVGIISKMGFSMGDFSSAALSLGFSGMVGAAMFFGVVKLMYDSQSNSTFSVEDIVGCEAEIITPIPEKGMGEIVLVYNGIRYNFSAKAYNETSIGRGESVVIKAVSGNTALVAQKLSIEDFENMEIDIGGLEKRKKNENNY